MRNAFINSLVACARQDPSVWLLTGDLGFSVLEPYRDAFPDRFINAGVAEANMVGTAAGLAASGKNVFIYSIIPFATFRALEQIRVDVCEQGLPVTIIGVGAGMTYGAQGPTHHALEDIAVMRALPGMTVVCPGDVVEAQCAARELVGLDGPGYVRLSRAGSPTLHAEPVDFQLGRAITLMDGAVDGADVTLISAGHILDVVTEAARRLVASGLSVRLLSMHTVKPIDEEAIERSARTSAMIFTIEEHSIVGGLGGAVAEALSRSRTHAPLVRLGLPDAFIHEVGSENHLRAVFGLTPEAIARTVHEALAVETFTSRQAV